MARELGLFPRLGGLVPDVWTSWRDSTPFHIIRRQRRTQSVFFFFPAAFKLSLESFLDLNTDFFFPPLQPVFIYIG